MVFELIFLCSLKVGRWSFLQANHFPWVCRLIRVHYGLELHLSCFIEYDPVLCPLNLFAKDVAKLIFELNGAKHRLILVYLVLEVLDLKELTFFDHLRVPENDIGFIEAPKLIIEEQSKSMRIMMRSLTNIRL